MDASIEGVPFRLSCSWSLSASYFSLSLLLPDVDRVPVEKQGGVIFEVAL